MKNKENLENLIKYLKTVQDEIQMALDGEKSLSKAAKAIGIDSNQMNYLKNSPSYFDTLLRKNFMSNDEFSEIIKNNQLPEERLVKAVFKIDINKIISLSDDEIKEVKNIVDNTLLPREKEIINMRFYDNLTFEQTGKELGITRERIRQIEVKAIRKLKWKIYESFKERYVKKIFTIDDLIDFAEINESKIERIIRLTMGLEAIISLDDFQTVRAEEYFIDNNLENLTEEDIIKHFNENPEKFSNFLNIIYSETDLKKYTTKRPTPIESYTWSFRTYNCLKRKGINTFEDFNKFSLEELMHIKNFGRKSLNEITTNIDSFNENKLPHEKIYIKGL